MLIETRAIGFTLTEAIRQHVESRVEVALGPFARRIQRVMVRVDDVNASRGGIDKRCSVAVTLRRKGVQLAEAIHADLYAAVDEAVSRIRRSVRRAAKQHLSHERKDRRRPGALITR